MLRHIFYFIVLILVKFVFNQSLQDLYMRQEVVVRIANEESDPGTIGRGVRQGCPISSLLFSIYAEVMMIEAMENCEEGIVVGGQVVGMSDLRMIKT